MTPFPLLGYETHYPQNNYEVPIHREVAENFYPLQVATPQPGISWTRTAFGVLAVGASVVGPTIIVINNPQNFIVAEAVRISTGLSGIYIMFPHRFRTGREMSRLALAAVIMISLVIINNALFRNEHNPGSAIPLMLLGSVVGMIVALNLNTLNIYWPRRTDN